MKTNKNIYNALKECGSVVDTIMGDITSLLDKKKIKYTTNTDSELVVYGKTKSDIKDILLTDIPKDTLKLLIQITETDDKVFIRQKFN